MSDITKDTTIPIQLWVADRSYRIRIKKEDEEKVRFATKAIDNRIADLKKNFAGRDHQDFIAMCLLMYATDQAVDINSLTTAQKDYVSTMIHKIDAILDDHV
jgi:cell division protein ZapA (FtsZ GTPase activity inhibitor)